VRRIHSRLSYSLRVTGPLQTASIRADDHATIGAILFAMLTPAFFWKQANVANRECFFKTLLACS